jgi:hypothetical protein
MLRTTIMAGYIEPSLHTTITAGYRDLSLHVQP